MRSILVSLALFISLLPAQAQLTNPSFETGMLPWIASPGVEIKGTVSGDPPTGVDGTQVAQLGLSGATNTYLYQTITLLPQTTYALSFSLGASAAQSGHEAKVRVRATNSVSGVLGSADFAVLSVALSRTNGYARHTFLFNTPSSAATNIQVVLIFSDVSTNGTLVDPRIDYLVLTQTSFPLLTNGGFENGFTAWPVHPGVEIYGPTDYPQIGTEGSFAAALGAADAISSRLEYHLVADPGGSYQLTFDVAAMGAAGLRAITLVEIISQPGGTVASALYTNSATGTVPYGKPPFQTKTVNFTVASDAGSAIIRFSDLSPNNGMFVDPVLDNVRLALLSAPPGLDFYAGIAVKGIVGSSYAVDYTDTISGVTNWIRLTNITLNVSPTLIFDISSTNAQRRFYRSVVQP